MRDKLEPYRSKRDFARTSEPRGRLSAEGARFVVHKHHATADHYDLRLELDGVLKSWAVPKGPSLDPSDKRLAVETEDHPLDYIDFEGVIPAGEYGGGPMIVWDQGIWAPMDDAEKSLASGAFKFRLAGDKLSGGWMLARLKPKGGETKRNWLLFKERDQAADRITNILTARPESVKSGRRIEELLASTTAPARAKPARLRPGALPGAVQAPAPASLPPQLAASAQAPANGDGWLHEIKLDGYRTLARIEGSTVRLITRGGLNWTGRYGALPAAFLALPTRNALIDGEVVSLDASGVSRFERLQDALSRGPGSELMFYAFDLPWLNGWDLTQAPLIRRKALLRDLLIGTDAGSAIQFSDHHLSEGQAFFDHASEMGLEGVVSKRADAAYQPGRSTTWTKSKAKKIADFVIAGYAASAAAGGLGALALAEWDGEELAYRGKVGTGFNAATIDDLLRRLQPLRARAHPLDGAPKDVIAVRPVLTARVTYGNCTSEGLLRHAVFKGLREVTMTKGPEVKRKRLVSEADLAAITITNPARRLFGRSGPTKIDIAVYYAAVGDFMLPHLIGRPVSLFRCPTGRQQDCFFQRHAFTGMPPTMARFEVPSTSEGEKTYIAVEDARAYLALAQFGVVEFHTWGALHRTLEKPDRVVFDLDPGEGIDWRVVVEAAIHVRDQLTSFGLAPFVKTTGSRGAHVVCPIKARHPWKKVHEATGKLAKKIEATAPDVFTTKQGPDNRRGCIFIDFHRNVRSATSVAPYSLRARNTLPASAPLSWENFAAVDAPGDLNYATLSELVGTSGDPWAKINDFARELPI